MATRTSSSPAKLGVLVGGTRFGDPATGATRHSFDILDLDAESPEPRRLLLDFLAHGFAVHPRRPREAALLEKRGPGGAYVDLVERAVIRPITPMPGHHFYGHGAFSREGDALFAVETDLGSNGGAISVRDAERFEVLDRFPTYGMAPHDCLLIEDGKTLVITNGGGRVGSDDFGSVAFVDVASRKLVEEHKIPSPAINAGHVAVGKGREFVVISAPRDGLPEGDVGGVSLRLRERPIRTAREPSAVTSRMKGESLSLCIHDETRTALVTHPFGNFISFWNLDKGALFAALDLPNARGVTLTHDRRYFAVSFGPTASLQLIETKPLRPVPASERPPIARVFGGSHIYTWSG